MLRIVWTKDDPSPKSLQYKNTWQDRHTYSKNTSAVCQKYRIGKVQFHSTIFPPSHNASTLLHLLSLQLSQLTFYEKVHTDEARSLAPLTTYTVQKKFLFYFSFKILAKSIIKKYIKIILRFHNQVLKSQKEKDLVLPIQPLVCPLMHMPYHSFQLHDHILFFSSEPLPFQCRVWMVCSAWGMGPHNEWWR